MKILLFGSKGQVGQEVVSLAKQKHIELFSYDIDSVDVTNQENVENCFQKHLGIDVVINAAAYTAVDQAEDEPDKAYAVNRDGVENIAHCCKERDIPMIHISTDYVFDGLSSQPYKENDPTNPLGIYGKSKMEGDLILQEILPQHVILRVSWVFGQYGHNFVKTILKLALEREELNIVGDQRGCPTPAADIARVLLAIASNIAQGKAHWGVYHYAGNPVTTWYDFAQEIVRRGKERFPLKIKALKKISTKDYPTKAARPMNSEFVVEKITRDYGVERHDWLPYLERMIQEIVL